MRQLFVSYAGDTVSLENIDSHPVFALWQKPPHLMQWIRHCIDLCQPSHVHLCNGSEEEYKQLCQELVQKGIFVPLKRPRSYWCHSDPADVARVEESTFICSLQPSDAGPTNNWKDPEEMKKTLQGLFASSMQGRTLYVIPFCMGPLDSPFSLVGVEITDSPYVVCNMQIMTRMGISALRKIQEKGEFIPCLHSVGYPLQDGQKDVLWPCNPQKYIVHFPEEKAIFSFGSGYGGNALLGKKSIALRIASTLARKQGWLAEHMLIIGVTNPKGKKKYFAAAFPSQCGKTNLALLASTLPGWKVECVGDDIAWMRVGEEGRLYAVNPEAGFFGVAPGTSMKCNPYAMETIRQDTIFTNVALTEDRDVWWEGMTKERPQHLIDWTGHLYDAALGKPAAHPNSRFTVSIEQCPIVDPAWNDPKGVPISAVIFGGRRSSVIPLVYEAFSWKHGVLIGASLSSETTAAAVGTVGRLRHDPFAMLPFCGYHMGDYFAHWLSMEGNIRSCPKIFSVNWFRKDEKGSFLWPGFGENIRVLEWIFSRVEEEGGYEDMPFGRIPRKESISMPGLDFSSLFAYDRSQWIQEIEEMEKYFSSLAPKFPKELTEELLQLKERILC